MHSRRRPGATTRSMTSSYDDEERRRYLEAGAEAAERGTRSDMSPEDVADLTADTERVRTRQPEGNDRAAASPSPASTVRAPNPPRPAPARAAPGFAAPTAVRPALAPGIPASAPAAARPALAPAYVDTPVRAPLRAFTIGTTEDRPRKLARRLDAESTGQRQQVTFAEHPPDLEHEREPARDDVEFFRTLREKQQRLLGEAASLNAKLEALRIHMGTRDRAEISPVDAYVEDWMDTSLEPARKRPARRTRPSRSPSPERAYERDPGTRGQRTSEREFEQEPAYEPRTPEPRTPRTARTDMTQAESIAASMLGIFEKMQKAARPTPKEIYDLPAFYGNVSEWRSFYNIYNETARRYQFSDYENVARLRAALKGEAKACVQHVLSTATRPELALRILKKQYGRSEVLLDQALEDLRRLPPVGPSAHDLNAFAIKIMNIVSTIMDLDRRHYADNPMLIREITDRLSPHLRSRWCDYARAHRYSDEPEIMQLADFLMNESEQELKYSHAKAPTATRRTQNLPASAATTSTRDGRTERFAFRAPAASRPQPRQTERPQPSKVVFNTTNVPPGGARATCLYCGGAHPTGECRKLTAQPVGARWDWAKLNSICFKCLESKHRREHCKAKGCVVPGCPHSHHRLLHADSTEVQTAAVPNVAPTYTTTQASNATSNRAPQAVAANVQRPQEDVERVYNVTSQVQLSKNVLLKVLPVIVSGPAGEAHIFAMLDDASTLSFIEEDVAEQIGLTGTPEPLCVRGINNLTHRTMTQVVKAGVRPAGGDTSHDVVLRTGRGLGLRSQTIDRSVMTKYKHLMDLGDECYNTAVPQMLIGGDNWQLCVPYEVRIGGANEPAAIRCALGWCFFGIRPKMIETNETVVMHCRVDRDDETEECIKKHWAIESLGVSHRENVKPADERAVAIFERTVVKHEDHYEVGQLWVSDSTKLPASYATAYSRLLNLEARMRRQPDFAREYTKKIEALQEKGFARRVNEPPVSDLTFYLPHFPVINIQKGKIRPVFDAAAKCGGTSLNDHILSGPDLLQSLLGILLRFRERPFAVVADIQDMFLRIRMREEDAASQLFLWRGMERDRAPQTYQLTRVLFGCNSSPCLAHLVRNRNAHDNQDRYPEAVYDIVTNHYMDDYVSCYDTEEDLLRIVRQVRDSHAEGGFILRGFASNSDRLIDDIPNDLRSAEPTASLGERSQKVLGMVWDPNEDTLSFNTRLLRVPESVKRCERPPTKRQVLSTVMSIYDPLGLIAQYTITAKIIMQRVWIKGTQWDEALDEEDRRDFFTWLKALNSVAELRIPRRYDTLGLATRRSLHVFADASTEAYCAAAYWRIERDGEVQVSLAAARTRVSPLKVLTVPRMELSAALIAARLAQHITNEQRYQVTECVYWTDSRTTLSWLRDDARQYKPFVSHRIAEIVELTDRRSWRWLPTNLNVADDGTRCTPSRRVDVNDRWYQGPDFLRLPERDWPQIQPEPTAAERESLPERKTSATKNVVHVTRTDRDPESVLPDITRFSNYDRLVNSTAYVLLFIEKTRTKNRTLQLNVRHLRTAELMWQQNSQRRSFPDELRALSRGEEIDRKSRLYHLAPMIDRDGVMKMRSRLGNAPVIYTSLNPIILDGRDTFTKLLITRTHRRSAHIHNEAVVNELRQNFWILHLRPSVKAVARACALCILRKATPRTQPHGDLPAERATAYERPFTCAAVDYAGPMFVTIGRRREKRWIALYTCLTTRAVHLECVHSLSADSALLALRRFAARRGWPRTMYSDNATNFRASAVELQAAHVEWLPILQAYGLQQRMEWKFIPPGNPSAGGAWERMVRTVKNAMVFTFHSRAPREEIFITTLVEIEYIVNQRPLTHVSVDPYSPETLTPNHFLLTRTANLPILGPCQEDDNKKWRSAQALADHFWGRWVKEIYPLLAPRGSSASGGRQIEPGDVVIIADPNGPRNVWPKGVVEVVHQGPDGRVRSADVRTSHGVMRRPTCKLAVVVPATSTARDRSGA